MKIVIYSYQPPASLSSQKPRQALTGPKGGFLWKKILPKIIFVIIFRLEISNSASLHKWEGRVIGEIRFSRDHIWVRMDDDIRVTLGVTDYLQEKLGEIYAIRLPEEGEEIVKEEVFSSLEAKNGRRELLAPISGEVIEVNYEAVEVPEIINEDPLAEGWLLKVEMPSGLEFDDLLTEEEYEDYLSEEEAESEEE